MNPAPTELVTREAAESESAALVAAATGGVGSHSCEMQHVRALKVYGERNTGTNFLIQLLAKNVSVSLMRGTVPKWWSRWSPKSEHLKDLYFAITYPHNLGWKHALAPRPDQLRRLRTVRRGIGFVTVTKNPYSWLISLHRRPYHHPGRAGDFLRFVESPWPTVGRERAQSAFSSPIAMWNAKNKAYLDLEPCTLNLRYEDVLADPEGSVAHIAGFFDLGRRARAFKNVSMSTKSDGRSYEDYREFYLTEKWREHLNPAARQAITRQLDRPVVQRYGYMVLD